MSDGGGRSDVSKGYGQKTKLLSRVVVVTCGDQSTTKLPPNRFCHLL